MWTNTIIQLISGLGIFLFGMSIMSEGAKELAGDKLRNIVKKVTNKTYIGIFIGLVVTSITQSSSVTTVILVGFVNASLINLSEAFGIILGANIGTTVTGWLLVLKIGKYGLYFSGLGAMVYLFSKKQRNKKIAYLFIGFGMIFLGLEFMKEAMEPLRSNQEFINLLSKFNEHNYFSVIMAALIGALVTALLQSSLVTVGLTMVLFGQGVIIASTAVALVLGENLGTTITAYLASINGSREARQVSYLHILNKILGLLIFMPFFFIYYHLLVKYIGTDNPGKFVASAHTIYNVLLTGILYLFKDKIINIVKKIKTKEKGRTVKESSEAFLVLERINLEIINMEKLIKYNFLLVDNILKKENLEKAEKLIENEDKLDCINERNRNSLVYLGKGIHSNKDFIEVYKLMFLSEQYESFGDYFASLAKSLKKNREYIYSEREKLISLNEKLMKLYLYTCNTIKEKNIEIEKEIIEEMNLYEKGTNLDRVEGRSFSILEEDFYKKYHRINRHLYQILIKFRNKEFDIWK